MRKKSFFLIFVLLIILPILEMGKVEANYLFDYIITATGTEDVITYPNQGFNWTVEGTGTEMWYTYPDQSFNWTVTGTGAETWYTTNIIYNKSKVEKPDWFTGWSIARSKSFIPVISGIAKFSAEYYGSSNSSGEFAIGTDKWGSGAPKGDVYWTSWRGEDWFGFDNVEVFVVAGQTYYFGFLVACEDCRRLWASIEYPAGEESIPHTATRTATDSGSGVVNKNEGNKFISTFSAYPQPQQGGTISGVTYSIIDTNTRVTSSISGNSVYAITYYSPTHTATRTATDSGSETVNALEGDKDIGAFSAYPQPQQGGAISGVSYSVDDNNGNVNTWLSGSHVYASTSYSETQTQTWSDTETGSGSVSLSEGDKYITTSSLVAPNNDTAWTVSDNNDHVETWMVGNQLYASVIDFDESIIYVDDDAPEGGNGRTWATAYNELQDALADARGSGGIVTEIRVAAGMYMPDYDPCTGIYTGDRAATFQLIKGLIIYGGLEGNEDPVTFVPNNRDFYNNETILSGDIRTVADDSDNSYHVVTGTSTDNTAVLDGFTITGGNANVSGHRDGGGMYNDGGSPTVANCIFKYNSADKGAGVANEGGSPVITNCIFSRNAASIYGGGIYNYINSNPIIANCTLSQNSAGSSGGGICNLVSSPTVTNSIIWGNSDSGGTDESAQIHTESGSSVVNYSCIRGLTGSLGGIGNISVDPNFVDAAVDNYHLMSEGWRWNIITQSWDFDRNVTSQCIDAGNPGSLLHNELFPVDIVPSQPDVAMNIRINMGAYGGTSEASLGPPDWALLADLDNNGIVDFQDFAHLTTDWFTSGNEIPGDLNRDGIVDINDLWLLANDWLKTTSWYND